MRPIVHLSFPVNNVSAAISFYTATLGAKVGRHTEKFVDLLLFGAQITLHDDQQSVQHPMPRSRHFGATIDWSEWEKAAEQLAGSSFVVEPPAASYVGEPIEQAKLMIADPSGNLIELKAYRYPANVLGSLVAS